MFTNELPRSMIEELRKLGINLESVKVIPEKSFDKPWVPSYKGEEPPF